MTLASYFPILSILYDYGAQAKLTTCYSLNSQRNTALKSIEGDILLLKVGGYVRNILKCRNIFKWKMLVLTLSVSSQNGGGKKA